LAAPSERAAKIGCARSRSSPTVGATDTVDPFAGSYYVEAADREIEAARAS